MSITRKYTSINKSVDTCLNKLNSLLEKFTEHATPSSVTPSVHSIVSETKSVKSHASSKRSKTSTMIARKLAKAEAARAKFEYSEKEALLKLQQTQLGEQQQIEAATTARKKGELEEQQQISAAAAARKKSELDIQLNLIEQKKEIAAAQAAAEVLENSLSSQGSVISARFRFPRSDPNVRTAEFVVSQTPLNVTENIVPLSASVPDFVPQQIQPPVMNTPHTPANLSNDSSANLVSDFSKFLLKKDLLLTRLSVFSDRPENYMVWKNSFKNIMSELSVSSFEELDLLVKWLGPETSSQVLNIRAAHANNPTLGLKMAWERLDNKFGCPEMVDEALKKKLHNFPRLSNKDSGKLYDLADIVSEIEALKLDPKYCSILSYYDASSGVIPIVNKLPFNLREKWVTHASNYKQKHSVAFPPFSVFCSFVRDMSRIRNDPSLRYDTSGNDFASRSDTHRKEYVISRKADVVNQRENSLQQIKCPLHKTNHSLNNCRAFRQKPFDERKKWIKEKGYCFKCCDSVEHKSKDCKTEIKCSACQSTRHPSALHIDHKPVHLECPPVSSPPLPLQTNLQSASPLQFQGGERPMSGEPVVSKCTQICGDTFEGKSCAKIVLVKVYHKDDPQHFIKTYAMLDDQSNRTLAKSDFFHLLGIDSNQVMSSCTGTKLTSGQIANGYVVEALDGSSKMKLPSVLECNEIPNIPGEIPTPEVARYHSHLRDIADCIPPLETQTQTLILIGRDLPEAHHVSCQLTGPKGSPYAQKLNLGWVIVGETCLGKIHKSDYVNVNKTYLLPNGRASHFQPCTREFTVTRNEPSTCAFYRNQDQYDPVFEKRSDDNKPAPSVEDRQFLEIMDEGFVKDSEGRWSAPLPFRVDRPTLPSNKEQAVRRAKILDSSLHKNAAKCEHFVNFMGKVIKNGHAEVAPPLKKDQECWFLPVFGVYHPQKPGEIRCVFDSSAQCDGLSLNNVLLQGPDMTNNLLGILLRFRREVIAIAADIQQMFYSFRVHKEHRNFLRFMWYEENDPEKSFIQYRMCVHVFGNSPSPAVATYGLRRTVENSNPDVNKFVNKDFYVDDALTSLPTVKEAVDLLKRTQSDLAVLFTCLCIRAIHIEVIEELSSSAFINALRRFVAIRGKVKQFRSDRGTNFVGSTDDLQIDAINVENEHVKKYLYDTGTVWVFNTPHSSHMGGVWERLIGVARRILDSILLEVSNLTHEVLATLMTEVAAIVYSRPLVPVSYDQEFPEILCPATILTHKTDMEQQQIQLDVKDLYRSQWKRVQHLVDTFWLKWKCEFLQTLQPRKKWFNEKNNLQIGDVVLMRDSDVGRTSWPIAKVVRVFPSNDGYVRKVEVKVIRDGKPVLYVRPVVEIVLLFSPKT